MHAIRARGVKADAPSSWVEERQKNRLEQHCAKHDPEVPPGYERYAGWET